MANESEKDTRSPRVDEAIDILTQFGLPRAQLNDRTAYCLLALLNITGETPWSNAAAPLVGITPMMDFARSNYAADYAPNTRETFRRFSMHQMVQAGIARYNPDSPERPTNSPKGFIKYLPPRWKSSRLIKPDLGQGSSLPLSETHLPWWNSMPKNGRWTW